MVHDAGSLVGDGLGGLGGSAAGPPVVTMPAAQTGFLGPGEGVGDWVDHGGPVKPEPVAGHGSELGERGHQGRLRGHDPGANGRGDGGVGRCEGEPANRTPEAVAESVLKHRYLGLVIALAGLFKAAEVAWHRRFKWLAFPWIALLLLAAAILLTYREPEGAYRTNASSPLELNGSPLPPNHQSVVSHSRRRN